MNALERSPLQAQNLSDAAARLKEASKMRYSRVRDQAWVYWGRSGTYWEEYKPRTLLQWTGFLGLSLLAVSALSAIFNVLGGMALGMAWVGLFVYFITVSSSTVAAFFCGSAMMMFSATCAVTGTCILGGVASVYAAMAAFARAKGYATPYLQQRSKPQQQAPTMQMRSVPQPQGSSTSLPGGSSDATSTPAAPAVGQDISSTTTTTQLLGSVSPGKPQYAELGNSTAATASNGHSTCSSDAPHKAQTANFTKGLKSTGIVEGQHSSSTTMAPNSLTNSLTHRTAAAVGSA